MSKNNDLVEFSNGSKHIEKGMVLRVIQDIKTFYSKNICLLDKYEALNKGEIVTIDEIMYGAFGSPYIVVSDKWGKQYGYIAPDIEILEYICG